MVKNYCQDLLKARSEILVPKSCGHSYFFPLTLFAFAGVSISDATFMREEYLYELRNMIY